MKREWTDLEFADWTLLPSEAALFVNKTGPTRLGFAILLSRNSRHVRFAHREGHVTVLPSEPHDALFFETLCRRPFQAAN